jgi:uncharacterized membrane protein YtjA (UPF0391 family)
LSLRGVAAPGGFARRSFEADEVFGARADSQEEGVPMMSMALTFLIVGLVAGLLGLWGIAAMASQIAWVLFLIGVVLLVLHMIGARRLPPAV